MHKTPLTEFECAGLEAHKLPIGEPSQCADAFRSGVAWAEQRIAEKQAEALDEVADLAEKTGINAHPGMLRRYAKQLRRQAGGES